MDANHGATVILAKEQHQQGTCSDVTGSLADILHPSGYDGWLQVATPAGVGLSSIHQGSDHVYPNLRGPLLMRMVETLFSSTASCREQLLHVPSSNAPPSVPTSK